MAVLVKIVEFGDELGIVLPEEVLGRLNAKLGDTLEFVTTPTGILVKFHNPEFERQMAVARQVMDENRDVLKRLAES